MDMIYRGYPLAVTNMLAAQNIESEMLQNVMQMTQREAKTWQSAEMKPYLLFNREERLQRPEAWDERRRMRAEYEYFRGMYPMTVRRWQRYVEEEFDRSDGPGSAIYDEYPDRESIYLLRDRIMKNAGEQGYIENKDLVLILVLNEMLRRRSERRQ